MNYKEFIEWSKNAAEREDLTVYEFLDRLTRLQNTITILREQIERYKNEIITARNNEYEMSKILDRVIKDAEQKEKAWKANNTPKD
jgi:hypothetical protein